MKKYIFLGMGIIFCTYIQAMEQLYPIPGNNIVPDYMKYIATCNRCKKEFKNISKAKIYYPHINTKCSGKLQYIQEPLCKYNILIQCPISGCNHTKNHIITYDSIDSTISKWTMHVWKKHNQSVESNIEFRNIAISEWHYVTNNKAKKKKYRSDRS